MDVFPEKPTARALLQLPRRKWDVESVYDSIILVPTGAKHDSGWGLIAIVDVVGGKPSSAEIAAVCDDVRWSFPVRHPYGEMQPGINRRILRTDCYWPGRLQRFWASGESYFSGRFKVGFALSSTDVTLVLELRGEPARLHDRLAGGWGGARQGGQK